MKTLYRIVSWTIIASVLLPLLVILLYSLSSGWFFPNIFPNTIDIETWARVFSPRNRIGAALLNSAFVAIMVSFLSLCIAFPAVIVVKRFSFLRPFLFIPLLMPPLAIVLGMFEVFLYVGLTNTYIGLIGIHVLIAIPFAIYILDGSCSDEVLMLVEQSRILGARLSVRIYSIYLPMMMPSITYTATMVFFLSWHQYLPNLIFAGGRIPTIAVQLLNFIYAGNTALSGVVALIFLLPSVIVTLIHKKYIKQVPWIV